MERPPPPVTVVVPGRGEQPGELLAVGPPPPRRPPLPLRERVTGTAAVVVLLAGAGTAARYEPPRPPPSEPAVVPAPLVAATAVPLGGGRFVERFALLVRRTPDGTVAAGAAGGDSGSPAVAEQVRVVGVAARGFVAGITGPSPPVLLGRAGVVTALDVEVRVVDCSVDTQAPRRLVLQVVRGSAREPVPVDVASDAEVVRVLDRLVSRTCRRPRG